MVRIETVDLGHGHIIGVAQVDGRSISQEEERELDNKIADVSKESMLVYKIRQDTDTSYTISAFDGRGVTKKYTDLDLLKVTLFMESLEGKTAEEKASEKERSSDDFYKG